jgi:hypothetical protein
MNNNLGQKIFNLFFCFVIFLIPWQSRFIYKEVTLGGQIWQYGLLSLYASLIVLLLAALVFGSQHRDQWHLSKYKWWYVLVFYALVSSICRPLPYLGLYYLLFIFGTILFIFLAQYVKKKNILWALLLSGLIQGILAIYQSITQSVSANKWLGIAEQLAQNRGVSVLEIGDMRILRAYGSLSHPNMLAGFLVLAILVALYLWHDVYVQSEKVDWQIKKIQKYTISVCSIIFSLVLMNFALLATFSRSALLALIITLLFILIFSLVKKDKLTIYIVSKYFIFMLMVFWAFNMYYPNLWLSRLDLNNRLETKSIQDRQTTYTQLDWTKPREIIFGQGLGLNTYLVYQKNTPLSVDEVQPIHNWFLLALAEVGLVGVLIFLILLYVYLKNSFTKNKNNIWFGGFVLLLLLLGLFDHYLWTSWTGWLMVGVVVAIIYNHQE